MSNNNYQLDKIIHQISYYPKKRLDFFRNLSVNQKRDVILRSSRYVQQQIVSKLNHQELVNLLELLDSDEATDILQLLPKRKIKKVIGQLNDQLKEGVSLLLKFDPETAAGLMNLNYIQIEADDNMAAVAKQVETHEIRTGKTPVILVVESGKLIGYLPAHKLGVGYKKDKATKYIKKILSIKYKRKTKEVLEIFREYPHNKVVVLGEDDNILGIIYSDDVLKYLREKEATSLYDFAGVRQEESVYDDSKLKIRYRYKWLMINLGTAFLAASVVGLFDETITKYVLLAVYMPIVAGMGGNAATQTLAVLVRGIALKQVELRTVWRVLKNELGAGLVNGVINGLLIALVISIKEQNIAIGLILAMALVFNLLVASFFGTIIPLIMKRLGKDPASSATIFITTATDVFGFLFFLGMATLILD